MEVSPEIVKQLEDAIATGRLSDVETLLDDSRSIPILDKMKLAEDSEIEEKTGSFVRYTPLHFAIQCGNFEVTKTLLQRGANVHLISRENLTPLQLALTKGHENIAELLIDHGADRNVRDQRRRTIFSLAAQFCSLKFCQRLLSCYEPIRDDDQVLKAVLKRIIRDGAQLLFHQFAGVLDHYGFMVNPEESIEILRAALMRENVFVAEFLLDRGLKLADVSKGDNFLHVALTNRNGKMIDLLLKHGSNLNSLRFDGLSPLHIAAINGMEHFAEILIQKGANPEQKSPSGRRALHFAASDENNALSAKYLLEHGVDVDPQDQDGFTPLHLASMANSKATVELLLNGGADVNVESKRGKTPLEVSHKHQGTFMTNFAQNLIEKHIGKIKEAGFKLSEKNKKAVESLEPEVGWKSEIEKMKSHKILDLYSLYDIFLMEDALYTSNEPLMASLDAVDFGQFEHYGKLMKSKIRLDRKSSERKVDSSLEIPE